MRIIFETLRDNILLNFDGSTEDRYLINNVLLENDNMTNIDTMTSVNYPIVIVDFEDEIDWIMLAGGNQWAEISFRLNLVTESYDENEDFLDLFDKKQSLVNFVTNITNKEDGYVMNSPVRYLDDSVSNDDNLREYEIFFKSNVLDRSLIDTYSVSNLDPIIKLNVKIRILIDNNNNILLTELGEILIF